MTHTITLDCERGKFSEEDLENEEGSVYLNYGENTDYYGNLESYYLRNLDQKVLAKRFRTFVQDDGEIGLEMKFVPGSPFEGHDGKLDSSHLKALWDNTRLHEIMSYEEYVEDMEDGRGWVSDCLGMNGEMYAPVIEVVKAGRTPGVEDVLDPVLEKPLWIQRKGAKYNVYIHYWQD